MDRRAVGDALEEIAALMGLKGENPFRVRAFANGARVVSGLADFEERAARGTLTEVKGIGQGLATEIEALLRTGASPMLEGLRREVPEGLRAIATIPGLGPKKARALFEEHGIHSLAELEYSCRQGHLGSLKGFGGKTEEKVLASLAAIRNRAGILRRDDARAFAEQADLAARQVGGRVFLAGAYRRGEILCDGVDLVLVAEDPWSAIRSTFGPFEHLPPWIGEPAENVPFVVGDSRRGFELRIWWTRPRDQAMAMWRAATPRSHIEAFSGITMDSIGCCALGRWMGTMEAGDTDPETEEDLYEALGLPFIPPELRGDGSEVALARAGKLPALLERSALRGCVHAHTTWSDGSGTVAEMLDAAAAAGLSWVGISDHSPTASYAGGLTAERLLLQQEEIGAEASKRPSLAVFKGTECDILGDGGLDYTPSVLDGFDFVVASVHSRFTMPLKEMTARVIRAIEDPHTTVLGHPTGRLLLGRDGYALDVPEVLRACAREGVAVELNAHPARLDLDPKWMPLVKELGVTVSIGPDAHEPAGFGDLDHGVAVARRAALPPDQVLNTRDAAGAREFFRARRRRGERP